MIIGIAGPTASGKTTVAKLLEKERFAIRIRYSQILSEMAKERGLDPEDKATLQQLFVEERTTKGESFLADELIHRVSLLRPEILVVEGNRRLVDIEGLKRLATSRKEPLKLIYIDAPQEVRFTRYNSRMRNRDEAEITLEDFKVLENNPAEDELSQVREIAKREGLYLNTENISIDETMKQVYQAIG
jgi:dephospho-CoA kinase